jgi:hypothetical protein
MIRARAVPAGVPDPLQKNIREGIVSATGQPLNSVL